MRIKLDSRWTKRLLDAPESGMGYQRVDVCFTNGRELTNVIVFNAEEVDLPDELAGMEITDLRLRAGQADRV
jgi:hypothetical protein